VHCGLRLHPRRPDPPAPRRGLSTATTDRERPIYTPEAAACTTQEFRTNHGGAFSPAVGIWARPIETGSGLSPNGEVSGRRVQTSRDSYEYAQWFFSMP
jgi:hypothetical protein